MSAAPAHPGEPPGGIAWLATKTCETGPGASVQGDEASDHDEDHQQNDPHVSHRNPAGHEPQFSCTERVTVRDTASVASDANAFAILCEVEPATTPDLRRVRRQIVAFDGITDLFLIPDNHIGRATVSSIAVAREVADLGGRAVACVNSRDRNLLGFRRDLLTAAAYGVRDFLFVHGDDPAEGGRSDLTVRQMLTEARAYPDAAFSLGVTVRCGSSVPAWKHAADFWLVQASFEPEPLIEWRRALDYDGQ